MQIKFKTSEIVKAVSTLMKVWKKNSVIPSCENLLFEEDGETLKITINNTYTMCCVRVTAETTGFSPFQVNAWDFNKMISSFSDDEIVIKSKASKLLSSNKKINIAISFFDDPIYPKISPIGEKKFLLSVEPENFIYFQKLSTFVSEDDRRIEFTTGKLLFKKGAAFLESTDAINLIRVNLGESDQTGIRTIYPEMMSIIGSMHTGSQLDIYSFDNCLLFEKDGVEYYGVESSSRYPDTDVFLDGYTESWIPVSISDLQAANKIVSPFSDSMERIVDISLSGFELVITGSDYDNTKVARYKIELAEDYKRKITSAFNAKFFGNVLGVFSGDVEINYSADLHGLGMRSKNCVSVMREIVRTR